MNQSPAIQRSIDLALAEGNEVVQTSAGWEKVDEVVHFRRPMTSKFRDALRGDTALRYWSSKGSPHNQLSEGFTDGAVRVALSFPVSP
ncbi:hypothetical protein QTH90_31175 [Variovorax sp. J2P1-59]|uniref:hypothetical protein n=1 Tax=Variovorax flavidus TaxID=3053501 RepID=UPI0025752482|nr:hypothetical protein [Variovorax sp. J2P1-59]MDM0078904.1 hypothetical protein [Variovorax sp. J2P1-59]